MNLKNMLRKVGRNKELHTVEFHLYEMSRKSKTIQIVQWLLGEYEGTRIDPKRHKGNFRVDGSVLKLDYGYGCITV